MGNDTHDDAGVFRLDSHTALVQTVDFFTPVVDDPKTFGAIAAVNSLSDIYAMGARPLTALNLVGFPVSSLPGTVLADMLQGGQDVLVKAGVALLGGHSIDDTEPKMGYALTGLVDPGRIWRNSTAPEGHDLYLSKAIGTGVIIKGIKDGTAHADWAAAATTAMLTLNQAAQEVLHRIGGPSSCTDVTGFGLLGHVWEMAEGAHVGIEITAHAVPLLPGSLELARADAFPGGSRSNRIYFGGHVIAQDGIEDALISLLFDAVTAGGLLFTAGPEQREVLQALALADGIEFHRIGRILPGPARIELV